MRRLSSSLGRLLIPAAVVLLAFAFRDHLASVKSWTAQLGFGRIKGADLESPQAATGDPSPGQQLVRRVISWLDRRPSIVARVRQRVYFLGQETLGDGRYWQQGDKRRRQTRWELQTGQATLVQVLADGRYLWADRRTDSGSSVTRVDLTNLRAALLSDIRPERRLNVDEADRKLMLARGGLMQLIAELERRFAFELADQPTAGEDRYTVVGHWKTDQLDQLWPGLGVDAAVDAWPEQLPRRVHMQIGREDLFPYVIEFIGGSENSPPLVAYEFHQVRFNTAIEGWRFDYAGSDNWRDDTDRELERLMPSPDPPQDLASLFRRRATRR